MKLPLLASLLLRNWKQICQGCRAFIFRNFYSAVIILLILLKTKYKSFWCMHVTLNKFSATHSCSWYFTLIHFPPPWVMALQPLNVIVDLLSSFRENVLFMLKKLKDFTNFRAGCGYRQFAQKSSDECFDIGCSNTNSRSSSSSRRSGKNCFPLSEVDGKWVAVKR